MGGDTERQRPVTELRTVAGIALLTPLLTFPIQAYYTPAPASWALLLIGVVHVAITALMLAASFTRAGVRQIDRLTLALVGGLTANLLLYLWLIPYTVPTYPTLTAYAMTFLLIMGAVLFGWSPRRVAWMGGASCAAFVLVGQSVAARGFAGG